MVPEKVAKDTAWKIGLLDACVIALKSGQIPEVQYPIDEELEKAKAEERATKFKKVEAKV